MVVGELFTKARLGLGRLHTQAGESRRVYLVYEGKTPLRMQVHCKLLPDSRTEKGSALSPSLHLAQFLHLRIPKSGQGGRVPDHPAEPRASARGHMAPRRGRTACPGRPSSPPSVRARALSRATRYPGGAPAGSPVARGPASTPPRALAGAEHQPLQRHRRPAIPAAISPLAAYLPRRHDPPGRPPALHAGPIWATAFCPFSSVHVPQDDVTSAALE